MKKKLIVSFSKALGLMAVLFVSTACVWVLHRPDVPEELK
jgi:cyclic lactone autoinducer peptide